MIYINFRCENGIETIEALETRKEARELLKEYNLISSGYYISQRATKDYYNNLKGVNAWILHFYYPS